MIRKYEPIKKIQISKLLKTVSLISKQPACNAVSFNGMLEQYFEESFTELQEYRQDVLDCLPNCLRKPNQEIQILITQGTIDSHRDSHNKRFILVPIRCCKNTILWEDDKEVILEEKKIYTINDYNYHGLITYHWNVKTIFIGIS